MTKPLAQRDLCPGEKALHDPSGWIRCRTCARVLVPTPTGKMRQHSKRGKTTKNLDQLRESLLAAGIGHA